MADKNLSFLPEDYLERRAARRTNVICLTLFFVVLSGIVGGFVVGNRNRAEAVQRLAQVKQEFAEAARRLEQLEELQDRKRQMIQKAHVTSVLVERVPRSLMLAELINHMPDSVSLLQLELGTRELRTASTPRTALQRQAELARRRQEAEAGAPVEVPETEVTIKLIGIAPTDVEVAQYMSALGRHEMFYDITLLVSEQKTVEQQTMREFRVELKLNQDIDVQQIEPTRVRREMQPDPASNVVPITMPERIGVEAGVLPTRDTME